MNPSLLVVGAGPAGLMAAIAAARQGARVTLLEQLPRPGAKLLATGGGHCNLTNTLPPEEFPARFGRQGRFLSPALDLLPPESLRQFFADLGVPTLAQDGFHVFPVSHTASSVLQALLQEARRLGVELLTLARAEARELRDGRVTGLATSTGPREAPRIILATGGRSYPALGATGTGYRLAEQAGHAIVPLVPALVPLLSRETWPSRCAGVTLSPCRLVLDHPGCSRAGVSGDLSFTHGGISGPAVLDLSREVSLLLRRETEVRLLLDLAPGTSAAAWLERFDGWQQAEGQKQLLTLLDRYLPLSLAEVICDLAGLAGGLKPAQIPRAGRARLAGLLTALPLTITATGGWDKAMVTRGGVSLKEVDPRTLESKKLPGLHFAGEILDLDGPCGGYNLQWAFSSGWLAGTRAAPLPEI